MFRFLRILVLLVLFFTFLPTVKADHMMGSDIEYVCISPGKYKVITKIYRQCSGIPLNSPTLTVYCKSTLYSQNYSRTSIKDITPTCNGGSNPCNPQNQTSSQGVEEHTFEAIVDFNTSPFNSFKKDGCCEVYFTANQCCRDILITTQPASDFYTESMLNICNIGTKCNSSPQLTTAPVSYVCCNQPFTFNNGAVDRIDGDSLSYGLVDTYSSKGNAILKNSPFTPTIPMTPYCPPNPGVVNCKPIPNAKPPRGFYFDIETGDIIFTPTKCDEEGPVVIEIGEWRKDSTGKWLLIGRTRRDMMLIVTQCANNNPPQIIGKNKYSVCEGNKLCFQIDSKDDQFLPGQTRADTTILSWNNGIPGATFTILNPGARERSAQFCWQTNIGDARPNPYSFTVTAKDDNCPRPAITVKGFNIIVLQKARATRKYVSLGCGKYTFNSTPFDTVNYKGNYFYDWEIRDSTNKGIPFKHSLNRQDTFKFKRGGKYIFTHLINNTIGCGTQYTDTLIVPPVLDVELAIGKDTFVCEGDSFSVKPIIAYGLAPYTFKWESPAGTFNPKDTFQRFALKPKGNVQIKLTLTDKNKCVDADTILVRYILNPRVNIGPDRRICTYENVVLDAGHADTQRYYWQPGGDSTRLKTINVAGRYIAKVIGKLGCFGRDTMNLFVNDTVVPLAGPDKEVCHNDTLKVTAKRRPVGYSRLYKWTDVGTGLQVASDSLLKLKATNASVNGTIIKKKYELWLQVNQGGHACIGVDTLAADWNPLPQFLYQGIQPRCFDEGDVKLTDRVAYAKQQPNDANVYYSNNKGHNWVTGGPYPAAQFYSYTKFITNAQVPKSGLRDTICYSYTDSNKCYNKECKPFRLNPNPDVDIRNATFCQKAGLAHIDKMRKAPFSTVGGIQKWRVIVLPPGAGVDPNSIVYNQGSNNAPDWVLDPGTEQEPNRTGTYQMEYCYEEPSTGCRRCDTANAYVVQLPVIEFYPMPSQCTNYPNISLNQFVNLPGGKWSVVEFSGDRDKTNAQVANALNNGVIQDSIFVPSTGGGQYMLKFIHTESGCPVSDSFSVIVNGPPTILLTPIDTLCSSQGAVDLVSNYAGSPDGKWSGFGVVGEQFMPDSSPRSKQYEGRYTLTYFYTNPITKCYNSDSIKVLVQSQPEVMITNSPQPVQHCEDQPFDLTATKKWAARTMWSSTGDGTYKQDSLNIRYTRGTMDTTTNLVTMTLSTVKEGVCPVATADVQLVIHPYPQIDFAGDPIEGCEPVTSSFTTFVRKPQGSKGNLTYHWYFGNGDTTHLEVNPQNIVFDTAARNGYDVKLVTTNSFPGGKCVTVT
ncbi:MAG: hypothetical protein H7321_06315, partial [Bacteroidia bacterium]|nr:hypothetical protein [Bacteroidia bacterium]